jgi:predicted dehydrogenase
VVENVNLEVAEPEQNSIKQLNTEIGEPVRVGVVGLGGFGRLHALTLAGLAESALVAIVENRQSRLREVSRELPGVPTWPNIADALREGQAEAWVIATPTEAHVPVAEHILMNTDSCVLIEKPLAESLSAARRLEPLAARNPSRIMLGHILLFAAETRQLLQEIDQRGPLVYFNLVRHRPVDTWDYYRETPFRLLMVHDLYLSLAMMQGVEPVSFLGRLHPRRGGGTDLARAELTWENGSWGSLTASYLTPPGMAADGFDRLEAFGEGWASRLRLNPQPLEIWAARAEWPLSLNVYADPVAPSGWLAEELRHFCRVVRGQAEPPLGARFKDAVRIQSWLECLESSALEAGGLE